jgi:hypothetical protein
MLFVATTTPRVAQTQTNSYGRAKAPSSNRNARKQTAVSGVKGADKVGHYLSGIINGGDLICHLLDGLKAFRDREFRRWRVDSHFREPHCHVQGLVSRLRNSMSCQRELEGQTIGKFDGAAAGLHVLSPRSYDCSVCR